MRQFKPNASINYLTLLFVIIVGVFVVHISIQLNNNQTQIKKGVSQIETQVQCVAGYFTTPGRTGNTILNCKVEQ